MAKRIEPKLVKGMRDQLGVELRRRRAMTETVSRVFESFGFTPLETPAIEFVQTLTGAKAGETGQRIYIWNHEEDDVDLGLRFDLTVPLARFVAAHPELRRPFKRYQTGSVFRVDKPGAGRFREFTQFDIDVVGTPSMLADAEIMVAMATALRELGLPEHSLLWNHRGILNAALNKAGVSPKQVTAVIRILDKADKIGREGVLAELAGGRMDDESGARIAGLELADEQIQGIADFMGLEAESDDALVDAVKTHLEGTKGSADPIREMDELRGFLMALGEGDGSVRFNPRLARGMDYYTGPIFEATLDALPEYGSIMGGGRYNELVSRFSSEQLPAVGASIGVDRLLAALKTISGSQERASVTDVLVTTMDKKLLPEYVALVRELRSAGLNAEIFLKPKARIGDQLRYASEWEIPFAVIMGSDEMEAGRVTVKDLAAGKAASESIDDRDQWVEERPGQFDIDRADLITKLKELLA